MKLEVLRLLDELSSIEENAPASLPRRTYFMKGGEIAALPCEGGESRYPYDTDGLVLWAKSSGYIESCESLFTIFRPAHFGEDPSVAFFGGIEKGDEFIPLSVTGAARQLTEPADVKRYTVFAPRCAYYITDTEDIVFAVRLHVDGEKRIRFAFTAVNKSGESRRIYMASYMESLLRFAESEGFWDKMSKFGSYIEGKGFILKSRNRLEDALTVSVQTDSTPLRHVVTTSRSTFLGSKGRCLANAECLRHGAFSRNVTASTAPDLPCASDIFHFELSPGEDVRIDYTAVVSHGNGMAEKRFVFPDAGETDREIESRTESEHSDLANMKITFGDWKSGETDADMLGRFIKCVQKQVSFCALGKNYAGPHIGIRDVFQQLESSLMWQSEKSREKMITALNYILSDGRPPRQFSVPADPAAMPDLDLRMYVDQGCWVISTLYSYLAFTDDYSILDETCTYYDLLDQWGSLRLSDRRDTVLDHLVAITDFLSSSVDEKTGCLRALYGDWNDALDGMGRTDDEGKDYGDGVTVMATLQLYRNYAEMCEILAKTGKYPEKIEKYTEMRRRMGEGLMKYAVVEKDGRRRVIHGWGDKRSYLVGSFSDCDGEDRISLTANAFWALSGMLDADQTMKAEVVRDIESLDSKYGLITFSKAFTPASSKEIGRLAGITEGTYENKAAYVHGSMFAIMALFSMGESAEAWRQLDKSMVITHKNATMTTFVMPNSYSYNPDYFLDGESMGDWYTGSGTVLIKNLVRFGLGIEPDLGGLKIRTPAEMPCEKAEITMSVKGKTVTLRYENKGEGKRRISIDGAEIATAYDEQFATRTAYIPAEDITEGMTITVTD